MKTPLWQALAAHVEKGAVQHPHPRPQKRPLDSCCLKEAWGEAVWHYDFIGAGAG